MAKKIDDMFGPDLKSVPSLTDQVAILAHRLGIESPVTSDGNYEPDAFLEAIKSVTTRLGELRDMLDKSATDLEAREKAVSAREAAVTFREKRISAMDALGAFLSPQPANERKSRVWFR